MAALLTSDQDDIDRVAIEVTECREMGIEVLPPNVNESFEEFSVIIDPEKKTEKIRFGLNAVKNVGHNIAHIIVEERKKAGRFSSLANFIERVESKDLNKKSIEALAKVGALEDLGERNQIVASIENIIADLAEPEIQLLPTFPATKKQQLAWEKELIGLYISGHPATEFQAYFESAGVPIRNITKDLVGQNISLGGVISKIKKIFLKNQKTMLFATIEDMYSNIELLVFPKILEETGSLWEEDKVILASGKISDKDGSFKLLVDSAKVINLAEMEQRARIIATQKNNTPKVPSETTKIIITLPQSSNQETLKTLSAHFGKCEPGQIKIYLKINNTKLETPYCITKNLELENEIKKIIPGALVENF
jgi:DNA polymerase-3 subunit alpha